MPIPRLWVGNCVMSRSSTDIAPLEMRTRPHIACSTVLLPIPDGPVMANVVAVGTSNERSEIIGVPA